VKEFSQKFKELISNSAEFERVIAGSCSPNADYQTWEDKRKFIVQSFNSDGTILDIGCANGFFLDSIREWSQYDLIPYGIDIEEKFIIEAKELYPEYSTHFATLDVRNIKHLASFGMPEKYDFIFWNFLGKWNIFDQEWIDCANIILSMATRRLVIGFYGSNNFPYDSQEWHTERERIQTRAENFKKAGFDISGSALNPTRFNQVIAWIDQV
jgi:SAM-dependent methyltransferase